ncbi:MAG: hypothetical protein AAF384_15725 [Pseudomonadota bacterium]
MSTTPQRNELRTTHVVVALLALACALRAYKLNSQLWLDEIGSVTGSLRRPFIDIATQWPGSATDVLIDLLAHLSIGIFGESAAAVRLPAMLFGVAGIWALFTLSHYLFPRGAAIFITALACVSYHHIFFSQNAAGYTALMFGTLWLSYLLLVMNEAKAVSRASGCQYALAAILTAYCHPFGPLVPTFQVFIALGLFLWSLRRASVFRFPLVSYLYYTVPAGLVSVMLYLPFVEGFLGHAAMNAQTAEEGPRFGFGLVVEIVEGLSAAFFGYAGLAIATGFGIVGVFVWLRRKPLSLCILVLPLFGQAFLFAAFGFGIHPRYFAAALPIVLMLGGLTIYELTRIASTFLPARVQGGALVGVLIVLTIASAYPLGRYYAYPKQDFLSAFRLIEAQQGPGDIRTGVQSPGSFISDYYGYADYHRLDEISQLTELEKQQQRIWVITSLERLMRTADAQLMDHIHTHYDRVSSFPGTLGDGDVHVYVGPRAIAQ